VQAAYSKITACAKLVGGVDGILQAQSTADSDYLLKVVGIEAAGEQPMRLPETLSKAYRWQYIVSVTCSVSSVQ